MVSKPPLTPEELDTREAELTARLARIEELEAQAIRREKAAKEREKAKKQVLLRPDCRQKGYFRIPKVPFYDNKQLFKQAKKPIPVLPCRQLF